MIVYLFVIQCEDKVLIYPFTFIFFLYFSFLPIVIMGGGSSKAQKKLDAQALHHNLEKFNPRTMELFRNLHITNETLNCLWKTFHAIGEL